MRKFINENNISFEEGNRNSSVVICIGYAQHLGWTKDQLETILDDEIEEDSFIQDEITRLWDYCKAKNYKTFWSTDEAKKQYNF